MKVIDLHRDLNELIRSASDGNRQSQRVMYQKYAPKLLSVCRQYINDEFVAEDLLVTSFMKIFTNLSKYEHRGPFEAWIRRVTVNECISYIRANKKVGFSELDEHIESSFQTDSVLIASDLQQIIDSLPIGCKMVFNLYAIDGFKHAEIADMLQITEGTSKSQLAYARKLLQQMIHQSNISYHG